MGACQGRSTLPAPCGLQGAAPPLPALSLRRWRKLIRVISSDTELESSSLHSWEKNRKKEKKKKPTKQTLAYFPQLVRSTPPAGTKQSELLLLLLLSPSMSLLFPLKPICWLRPSCHKKTFCSSASTRAHTDSKKERWWEEGGRIVQNK